MKKTILILAIFVMGVCGAQAQTEGLKAMYESKAYDNWYIGINGGLATKTTHSNWINNCNLNAGLRVGRWFTPAFGLVVDGNTYFGDKPQINTGTWVKYLDVSIGTTINLGNWWFGYAGQPRLFEVIAIPELGCGHVFGNSDRVASNLNDMTAKIALDFAFNVDKKKSLQVYLEPALLYSVYGNANGDDQKMQLNVNKSHFQLNVGLVYKFRNSNGTHNFRYAEPQVVTSVDNSEISRLNARINELEAENAALKNRPAPCVAPRIITREVAVLEPTVVFKQGSSVIEKLQYANIENVAKYMQEHMDSRIKVVGYASTEGTEALNQKLSEDRAAAVKQALVQKYNISADRLETEGKGATDERSEARDLNRVAVFQLLPNM